MGIATLSPSEIHPERIPESMRAKATARKEGMMAEGFETSSEEGRYIGRKAAYRDSVCR